MTDINKTIEEFYAFLDEHKNLDFLHPQIKTKTKTMSVKILEDEEQNAKVLYCSSTMMPIGCIMLYSDDAEHFLEWLPQDARLYSKHDLIDQYYKWREEVENGEHD